jgi:hypothetical protein
MLDGAAALAQYNQAKRGVSEAEAEVQIALLGKQVAEIGIQMAHKLRDLAAIDKRRAALELRFAGLQKEIGEGQKMAGEIRLQLAAEARDICFAQLGAMQGALAEAKNMVAAAKGDLQEYTDQLKQMASQIRDQKKRKAWLGILKAVVSVAGAALGPFTGGASCVIASAVNKAVDLGVKIHEQGFSWTAVGEGITAVAQFKQDFSKLGSEDSQQSVGKEEYKNFGSALKSAMNGGSPINGFAKQAEDLLGRVGGDAQRFMKFAAMAAANVPTLDGGQSGEGWKFALSDQALELKGALGQAAQQFVDVGGVIKGAGDIVDRVAGGQVGSEAVVKCVGAALSQLPLPETLREKLNLGSITNVVDAFEAKKSQFLQAIASEESEVRSRIERAVATGALLTKVKSDAGHEALALISRDATEELKSISKDMEAMAKSFGDEAIGKFAKEIKEVMAGLNASIKGAQETKDDAELERIATDDVPGKMNELDTALGQLSEEVAKAERAAENAVMQYEAAGWDLAVAKKQVQLAEAAIEIARVGEERADVVAEHAELAARQAGLMDDQAGAELELRRDKLQNALARLRDAAALCAALGILEGWADRVGGDVARDFNLARAIKPWRVSKSGGAFDRLVAAGRGILSWYAFATGTENAKGMRLLQDLELLSTADLNLRQMQQAAAGLLAMEDEVVNAVRQAIARDECRVWGNSSSLPASSFAWEFSGQAGSDQRLIGRACIGVTPNHIRPTDLPDAFLRDIDGRDSRGHVVPMPYSGPIWHGVPNDRWRKWALFKSWSMTVDSLSPVLNWYGSYRILTPSAASGDPAAAHLAPIASVWTKKEGVTTINLVQVTKALQESILTVVYDNALSPAFGTWVFEVEFPLVRLPQKLQDLGSRAHEGLQGKPGTGSSDSISEAITRILIDERFLVFVNVFALQTPAAAGVAGGR